MHQRERTYDFYSGTFIYNLQLCMDYGLYTWPLIQHTINQRIFFLTQDDKKPQSRQQTKPEFYHAISLRPLYEITQTSMQDHSAYPTHAPSPKWHTTETPLKNLARSEIPGNSMYSESQMHGQRNHSPETPILQET